MFPDLSCLPCGVSYDYDQKREYWHADQSDVEVSLASHIAQPIDLNHFSRQEAIHIYNTLQKQSNMIQLVVNLGQDLAIPLYFNGTAFHIKQKFTHGQVEIVIQSNKHDTYIAPISLMGLINQLDCLLHQRHIKFKPDPPIKALICSAEVSGAVAKFKNSMTGWGDVAPPHTQEQVKWNWRVFNARHHLSNVESVFKSNPSSCYIYQIDDIPVGMMVLSHFKAELPYLFIYNLVTHPGSTGVGGSLVEWAVQQSVACGCLGKLTLECTESSQPAYLAMGFKLENINSMRMTLDPASCPDQWLQNELRQWKLKSHDKAGYCHAVCN